MAPRPIDSDSSDDDAPEAVTLTQSKTAARERSKALTQHHAELNEKKREKNRRRDQQLKEQAKERKPSGKEKTEREIPTSSLVQILIQEATDLGNLVSGHVGLQRIKR